MIPLHPLLRRHRLPSALGGVFLLLLLWGALGSR
jgi:hypothetical protein